MHEMDEKILRLAGMGKTEQSAKVACQLLKTYGSMDGSSWFDKKRTLYDCFQMGIAKRSTMRLVMQHIQQAYELAAELFSPDAAIARTYRDYSLHPETHRYYLIL